MSSLYAVALEVVRNNPGLTPAQIAAKCGVEGTPQESVDLAIDELKKHGRVVQTGGDYATATFAVAAGEV